jgi:Ca2+-binding EF-hand superfamily protein
MAFVSSGNATLDFGPIVSVSDLSSRLETLYTFQKSFGFFDDNESLQAL